MNARFRDTDDQNWQPAQLIRIVAHGQGDYAELTADRTGASRQKFLSQVQVQVKGPKGGSVWIAADDYQNEGTK